MAQPPAYNREKNFTLNSGRETDHSALNAELDRASNSINDIRTNLAILQADDGKLRPAVVTADSISEELRVSLVEGVVMDAQSMLDRSLAAADASSAFAEASSVSAKAAKASEEKALESSSMAGNSAKEAADSAKAIALAINSDWDATEGAAEILNKPALSAVALSGNYEDLSGKPDNLATDDDIAVLQEEIAKKGVPVGTIEYFATSTPPAGYLKADGAAVGRETYPDLFAAIGTAFGEGDGSTTFNLPDLIGRFAQGSDVPGQKLEAGLPNAIGKLSGFFGFTPVYKSGALSTTGSAGVQFETIGVAGGASSNKIINLDLSESNPIYGASDTVQPPALTLLPCIKAFDAATDPGLIDITELAQEMADKTDKMTAANAAMPSDRYVDLTLPVSLSTITAPADGYIFFEKITTAANQYVALYVNAPDSSAMYGANNDLPAANAYPFVLIPVKKGAVVTVEYNAAGTYTRFRFIYANGSVQQ
ncbi:phage tail protein [Oxalobacter formigenes]|uniref:Phage Tail Collar Domain protein n=1 Tax=Oxalobacter formigenes OXCC13 TaxID=556269 RepID=C3X8V5_OXAFO|nr:Phage Tail Collar Domain protein [Oxalobacter formigenes]ARQ78432.1 phage tail protein [Oxalobacter formigenes OXCC13]EEO29631.1 phage Tail Collar Domain protein [Oxalobacter formigenes OXCC13]QDX32987.1 phage tail protein [Oxalobacter formigenes]